MDKKADLISRLQDEADLCRNDGATDIAALLDEAVQALRDRNHDTAVGEKWRTDSRLEEWFPLTAERMAAKERENLHLAREARTWWEAAQTYAANAELLREALRDLLAAHGMRASCQAGMVERCKCVPCATTRAREALGPNG